MDKYLQGERLHNGEIVKDHGNYITIKHATRHHSGRYQCLAEDGSEKPAHEAIEVVVKCIVINYINFILL